MNYTIGPDFAVSEYKAANFCIMKSYSEDNAHKSIKYGGLGAALLMETRNQMMLLIMKLKKKEISAQFSCFTLFCDDAEMIEPVDFDKKVWTIGSAASSRI
ncbi:hypothetical protein KSP39_PZI017492 [Platanthera zijinensis]|uniref:Uncharacterized protein n=1 Tax=Platanthera zijinensis TaxID=2320716 RepID=A0AAP0FZU1_9ASPA